MEHTARLHSSGAVLVTSARSLTGWQAATMADAGGPIDDSREDFARSIADSEAVIHVAPEDAGGPTSALRARRQFLASTRRLFRVAADVGARVVIPLSQATTAEVESGTRSALLASIAGARASGLDVRTLSHGVPVGPHDAGPSWLGCAMLRFAAGDLGTYVPATLPVVPSTDVGRSLVTLARDPRLARADAALPSALVTVPQLFEFWADCVGPRSRPRARPTSAVPALRRLLQRALPRDFDAHRFSDRPPTPTWRDAVRLPRYDSVPESVEAAFSWFAAEGFLRCARSHATEALHPCTSHLR